MASKDKNVVVSVLHPVNFKGPGETEFSKYMPGHRTMPLSHAEGLGLLHRVKGDAAAGDEAGSEVEDARSFSGKFGPKLTATLEAAGYKTLAELAVLDQDKLMALGIGPANYERIVVALRGSN